MSLLSDAIQHALKYFYWVNPKQLVITRTAIHSERQSNSTLKKIEVFYSMMPDFHGVISLNRILSN